MQKRAICLAVMSVFFSTAITRFEITDEHLETGMRGFPVGYCTTSHVDPYEGLFYREIPIKELAMWDPEKVIHLLMYGNQENFESFQKELQERSKLHPEVKKYISSLPRAAHPMQLLSCALTIMGVFEGKDNYSEDCLNVIAKIPELVATVINYHAGWGETPQSKPELGYMENFTQMLNIPNVQDRELLTAVFRLFNILHYDHGGGNLSTFVGKAVASSLEDMYGSLSASMYALAGSRHGKANQESLAFLREVQNIVGEDASGDDIERLMQNRLKNKELICGFGHAVLRVEDPRATICYDMAKTHWPDHPLVKIALLLRERGSKVLQEDKRIKDPYPNVDAISGILLSAAGFDFPEYFTVLFGLSRIVGIARQIEYERCEARGGKGTPIVRPKYIYKHA